MDVMAWRLAQMVSPELAMAAPNTSGTSSHVVMMSASKPGGGGTNTPSQQRRGAELRQKYSRLSRLVQHAELRFRGLIRGDGD